MQNFSAAIKCKQQGQEVTYFALGPWKPCPCEKNRLSGSGTHRHICADVARIDIRVFFSKTESEQTHTVRFSTWEYLLKAGVVSAKIGNFL